jgi:hypothetical protein
MNSKHDRGPAGRNSLRISLLFLAVTSISSGLWAFCAPVFLRGLSPARLGLGLRFGPPTTSTLSATTAR